MIPLYQIYGMTGAVVGVLVITAIFSYVVYNNRSSQISRDNLLKKGTVIKYEYNYDGFLYPITNRITDFVLLWKIEADLHKKRIFGVDKEDGKDKDCG